MEPKTTIDELAKMVHADFYETTKENGKRFDDIDKRFDGIDKRFDGIDERLNSVDARLGRLETDVSELRGEIVYRHESR